MCCSWAYRFVKPPLYSINPLSVKAFQSTIIPITSSLNGCYVLITAGPTQEAIDPVRYISNHSTGKMGYALAEELTERGAQVTLVSVPTQLTTIHPGIRRVNVRSAAEMYKACCRYFPDTDVAILVAAVADYMPKVVATEDQEKGRRV